MQKHTIVKRDMDSGEQNNTYTFPIKSEVMEITQPCSKRNSIESLETDSDGSHSGILNLRSMTKMNFAAATETSVKIEMEENSEDSPPDDALTSTNEIFNPEEYTNNHSLPGGSETNILRSSEALRNSTCDIDDKNGITLNENLPILNSSDCTTRSFDNTKSKENRRKIKTNLKIAGPSRIDCELLHEELQSTLYPIIIESTESGLTNTVKKMGKNKNTQCEQLNIIVKQEVDDLVERVQDLNESTSKLGGNRNTGKRSGSPFEAIEIKREKLDDEHTEDVLGSSFGEIEIKKEKLDDEQTADFSGSPLEEIEIKREQTENFLANQMCVKNEIHEATDDCSLKNTNAFKKTYFDCHEEKIASENVNNNKNMGYYDIMSIKTCVLCDVYIEGSTTDHLEKRHRNGIFFCCPFCDSDMNFHVRKQTYEAKKHKWQCIMYCEYCDEEFPNWVKVSQHKSEAHSSQVSKQCSMCDYEAPSYSSLLLHILCVHNGQTLIQNCQYCDFTTLNSSLMKLHMSVKHQISDQLPSSPTVQYGSSRSKIMIKCPICDMALSNKRFLTKHISFMHSKR